LNNLNRSQQLLTQKIVRFQQKWSDKKIERISGNPVATMFRDKDLSKYDIICSQGALTNHQKQLQFSQMVELRQLGVEEITGSMLLKHAPIQAKTELLKEVEANAQAASQQAQKMEELQMQQLDIQNKLSEAEIVSKLSLSTEREARAKADIGLLIERTSESKQNQSEAVLNQVKAAAEIQGMEQDQLMSALQFVMELQAKAEIDDKEREIVSSNVAESGGNKPVNT